jgi:hypothetical protein
MTHPPYPRLDESLHRRVCDALLEVRRRYPDYRLGQLIAVVALVAERDAWGIEDDELLAAAESFVAEGDAKALPASANPDAA